MILSKNKDIDNATKNVCNAQMIEWEVTMMKNGEDDESNTNIANWPCKHCNIKFKKFKNHN